MDVVLNASQYDVISVLYLLDVPALQQVRIGICVAVFECGYPKFDGIFHVCLS